ncbi:hypothetical protein AB0K04_17805 [Micromonospora coxensis]|uniref:hypothetical protein n=1 Tax=Micromonospora coxensis TaxID=356852 RepID=UPI00343DF1E4
MGNRTAALIAILALATTTGAAAPQPPPGTAPPPPVPGTITRVNVSSTGAQSTVTLDPATISGDGRHVAFTSHASNLAPGDTNGVDDVFVHDRVTRQTRRISLTTTGAQASGPSSQPRISADGRHVAFASTADDLVAGDTNEASDVFVHDRVTRQTRRISLTTTGAQATGSSSLPGISADGRHVAFYSNAPDLVAGDTNGHGDVFLHDRSTGSTIRLPAAPTSTHHNFHGVVAISDSGRYVSFSSYYEQTPCDLHCPRPQYRDVQVYDRTTGLTRLVDSSTAYSQCNRGSPLSDDGHVAYCSDLPFTGDTPWISEDVFVQNLDTAVRDLVAVSTAGVHGNLGGSEPAMSADARYVAFQSHSSNLLDNRTTQSLSVYLRDRTARSTIRVSVPPNGEARGASFLPDISDDGRHVLFFSHDPGLVPGDTNGTSDLFVWSAAAEPGSPSQPPPSQPAPPTPQPPPSSQPAPRPTG